MIRDLVYNHTLVIVQARLHALAVNDRRLNKELKHQRQYNT
jgi:hypothetical protein